MIGRVALRNAGKAAIVGRWVRACKGMDETVMEVALEMAIDNNEGVKRRKN